MRTQSTVTPVLARVLLAALVGVSFAGCLIAYDPDGVELAETDTTPRLAISSPTANQQVAGCLVVRLSYFNFELVDPDLPLEGTGSGVDRGHYLLDIDGATLANPGGEARAFFVPGLALPLANLNFTPGSEHTVTVRTRNHDGTPHEIIQPARVTWIYASDGSCNAAVNEGTGAGS